MDSFDRERLLAECARAQQDYVETLESARRQRQKVFAEALRTKLSAREISEVVGLSGSRIIRISKGQD